MPYKYRPLSPGEIRLLTIEPGSCDLAAPVRCTLDHASLPRASCPPTGGRFKGDSYVWPETQAPYDHSAIFKKGAESKACRDVPFTQLHAASEPEDDSGLPWRHAWGDYITLSYAWGAPDPSRLITLDGHSFSVSPNLFDALIQLRQAHRIRQGFKVWVDAICINQEDTEERSQEVTRMRDIYASAWQVVIWLGPEMDDSTLALTALSWISPFARANPSLDTFYRETWSIDARPLVMKWASYKSPLRKKAVKALFFLFSRPYWGRMWILQEVAKARADAPVLCGGSSIIWRDIHDAAQFIAHDEGRVGRDIVASGRVRLLGAFTFDFGASRVVSERRWASERMWGLLVDMMVVQQNQTKPETQILAADTLRPLLLARDASLSEEKDRVYGILGFREIADLVTVVPDYKLPLRDIYLDFAAKVLETGDLNILRLGSGISGFIYARRAPEEPQHGHNHSRTTSAIGPLISSLNPSRKPTPVGTECTHRLPSWAICWTCRPAPTAQLRGPYNAGGRGSPVDVFRGADSSFTVTGYILDTVGSLSSFHLDEVDACYPVNTFQTRRSVYGDLESTRAALWRTIVADTTAKGGKRAPESYSWLLNPGIWGEGVAGVYSNRFGPSNLMAQNHNLVLCGYSLKELIFGRASGQLWLDKARAGQLYNPTKEQCEALSWAVNATAWRRLMGTKKGRMGLAPAGARVGDSVAVLLGCSTPVILRELSDGWVVVGESYVHGAMYGEMLRRYDDPGNIKLY